MDPEKISLNEHASLFEELARASGAGRVRSPNASSNRLTVDPPIFWLRLHRCGSEGRLQDTEKAVADRVTATGATVYLIMDGVCFAYPKQSADLALQHALAIERAVATSIGGDWSVTLSRSTTTIPRYSHIAFRPWEFLGTRELENVLTGFILFNPIDSSWPD